jgi:hypothetical protein
MAESFGYSGAGNIIDQGKPKKGKGKLIAFIQSTKIQTKFPSPQSPCPKFNRQ